jgi:phosphate transport system substrate-binding protein
METLLMSANLRALALISCLVLGLAVAASARAGELKVGGTGTATPLLAILAEAFGKGTEATIEVVPSLGSSGGLRALGDGVLDIAVSGRPLEPSEAAKGFKVAFVARTPFILVTSHPKPKGLGPADIVAAFAGEKMDWQDGTPIKIILRPRAESDTALMGRFFPHMATALEKARRHPDVPVAATDQDNLELAERIAGSLTATTLAQAALEGRDLRPVAIGGVEPTLENLERGAYAPTKEIYFVARSPSTPLVEAFIAFLRSPEGRAVLRTGHVLSGRAP